MSVRIPPDQIQNLQQIEATVNGPDGATRLLIISGQFNTWLAIQGAVNAPRATETFTLLVGPVLTRPQFYKAIATASINTASVNITADPNNWSSGVSNIDADWDDESGQVELKVEAFLTAGQNVSVFLQGVTFQVTILAA